MRARAAFRDRDPVDVAVLDALVDRSEEGMTVLELRSRVDSDVAGRPVDIDDIEAALSRLKADGLISVESTGDRPRIRPHERVVPTEPDDDRTPSLLERVRGYLPF